MGNAASCGRSNLSVGIDSAIVIRMTSAPTRIAADRLDRRRSSRLTAFRRAALTATARRSHAAGDSTRRSPRRRKILPSRQRYLRVKFLSNISNDFVAQRYHGHHAADPHTITTVGHRARVDAARLNFDGDCCLPPDRCLCRGHLLRAGLLDKESRVLAAHCSHHCQSADLFCPRLHRVQIPALRWLPPVAQSAERAHRWRLCQLATCRSTSIRSS